MDERNQTIKGTGKAAWKNLCAVLLTLAFTLLLLGLLGRLTERKTSRNQYGNFLARGTEADVLFLGSSRTLYGLSPMQLYDEYGITSFNLAKEGGMLPESYWMLKNALDYADPECVVIDVWSLDRDFHFLDEPSAELAGQERELMSHLHKQMDFLPLTKTKWEAICDLLKKPASRLEFLWNFALYHDRWRELDDRDFSGPSGSIPSDSLGASGLTALWTEEPEQAENHGEVLGETEGVKYLERILELCEERGIRPVLAYMPSADSHAQEWAAVNTAQGIADEWDIPFINLLPHDQTVIDYRIDMADGSHVNAAGMAKLTRYVGGVLLENFPLPDRRGMQGYEWWGQAHERWKQRKREELYALSDLYLILSELSHTDVSAVVLIRAETYGLSDRLVQAFIENLTHTEGFAQAVQTGGPYLLWRDVSASGTGEPVNYEFPGEARPDPFLTMRGMAEYRGAKDYCFLSDEGDPAYNLLDMEAHYGDPVQIILMDPDGTIRVRRFFGTGWQEMP